LSEQKPNGGEDEKDDIMAKNSKFGLTKMKLKISLNQSNQDLTDSLLHGYVQI